MKEYHEVACVKDGNEVVGFLIASNSPENSGGTAGTFQVIDYVDMNKMKVLCANNKMDYLIYSKSKDRLEVLYTKEDMKRLHKLGFKDDFIGYNSTLQTYLQNDIIIKKKYLDVINANPTCLLYECVSITNMPLMGDVCTFMIFGNMSVLVKQIQYCIEKYDLPRLSNLIKIYKNNAMFTLPNKFIYILDDLDILIGYSTLNKKKRVTFKNPLKNMVLKAEKTGEDLKPYESLFGKKNRGVELKYAIS